MRRLVVDDEYVVVIPVKVPNRLSAIASGQRVAAQFGHHSALTYNTWGNPFAALSKSPVSALGGPAIVLRSGCAVVDLATRGNRLADG